MSVRAEQYAAQVLARETLSAHLIRLTLGGDGLAAFASTGIPDEWVGLVVPGQFQSRYYTVRSWREGVLTLDVVVHESGLVTQWASGDCVGDTVTVVEAKGSFDLPEDAEWVWLVGDLTAWPAMARIVETLGERFPVRIWAEGPEQIDGYFPPTAEVTWIAQSGPSRLAEQVEALAWPSSQGYFWMAGESAQMRAVRKHLMRVIKVPTSHYDVMGYWRAATRQPRAVDATPSHRQSTLKESGL